MRVSHREFQRRRLAALRAKIKGVPKSPEHRARISAALAGRKQSADHTAKSSAARIGLKLSPETKAKLSEIGKQRGWLGTRRQKAAARRWGKSNLGKNLTEEHSRRIAESLKGKLKGGRCQKGMSHHKSKHAVFRSPNRTIYEVTNVTHFVRTHRELFDEPDLVWRTPHQCNASHRLADVARGVKRSWKEWTAICPPDDSKKGL